VVVFEHENDEYRRETGRGERQQPAGVAAGHVLDVSRRTGSGVASEVALEVSAANPTLSVLAIAGLLDAARFS